MEVLYNILFFIIGCIFGSFYHVVGYRLPKKESLIHPKSSYCPSCNHKLASYDLIPVLSYVLGGGKCRYCKAKISVSYPIIELVTGLLFALSYHLFGFSYELGIALILSSLLSIILVSDIKYLIIPDTVTLTGAILLIVLSLIQRGVEPTFFSIVDGLIMFFFMYGLMLLGNFLFKKESLGGADIKLMFLSGFLLGPLLSLITIFIASCIALPISIILYITKKENRIPFGPFLMIGMMVLYFFQVNIDMIINILKI